MFYNHYIIGINFIHTQNYAFNTRNNAIEGKNKQIIKNIIYNIYISKHIILKGDVNLKNKRIKTMLFSLTIMGTLGFGSTIAFATTTPSVINLKDAANYTVTYTLPKPLATDKLITQINSMNKNISAAPARILDVTPKPINMVNPNLKFIVPIKSPEKAQSSDAQTQIRGTQQSISALSQANQAPESLLKLMK